MSEQDKKSNPPALGGPSLLVVDQTQGSKQKQLFRTTELQQEKAELHHKRSRAFGVPCVGDKLKDKCPEANGSNDPDNKEEKEQNKQKGQDVVSSDKQKQMLTKKLSSSHKKHDTSDTFQYETITLAPVNVENKINLDTKASVEVSGAMTLQPAPSVPEKESASKPPESKPPESQPQASLPEVSQPPDTKPLEPVTVIVNEEAIKDDTKKDVTTKDETTRDDTTKDVAPEQPKGEVEKKQSDWSYLEEEQAGGLPRETRASRVSRSMRTFFCCGVPYEAASEDDISVENYVSGI